MDKKDIIGLSVLFLVSFFIWTLPIQQDIMPFGEGDASHQYIKSDYMVYSNKAGVDNPFFLYRTWYSVHLDDPAKPVHPPIFFVSQAAVQILGGHRFIPKSIFLALTSNFFVVVSVYFLIRKLYGFWYASLSGFMLIFSFRNFMSYAWGQRPILLAMGFIPLILYSYYKYSESIKNKKEDKKYLIILSVLVASVIFIHAVALWAIFVILLIFTLLFSLKNRQIPFKLKTVSFALLIFIIIFAPFSTVFLGRQETSGSPFRFTKISPLFSWYGLAGNDNLFMWRYNPVHGGFWTLPFLLFGILYLLIKRRDKDILMLSWLIGLYFVYHFAFGFFLGRADRLVKGESHLFYPLIVIGLLSIQKFLKISKIKKQILSIALIVVFIILVLFFNAPATYDTAKNLYSGIQRLTPEQLEAAEWIDANLPEKAIIFHQPSGSLFAANLKGWLYQKMRWKQVLSHRAMHDIEGDYNYTHAMMDYSDFMVVGAQDAINILKNLEENLQNATLMYDKNNIKVYELE